MLRLLLVLALLVSPADATVFAFRCTNWPITIEGYLDTAVRNGYGALWAEGQDKHWWLTGFDSWWHGPFLNQDGYYQCLVIHPDEPWIVGMIYWQGTKGRMDILSTNGERFEFDLTVELVIDGDPDQRLR